MPLGSYPYGLITLSFSASPTFDCGSGNVFAMTLTGAVTSMSVINAMPGQLYSFIFTQDGTGLHAVTWPASFKGVIAIPGTALANKTSIQAVLYDGSNFWGVALGQINL